jgi:SAM-dependent methyltransferase
VTIYSISGGFARILLGMIESCPVCESVAIEIKGAYRGIHPAFEGLNRARCNSCGMVFATPMPDDELLSEYNASYFESAHGGASSNAVSLAFFSAIARLRQAFLEKYLNSRQIRVSSVLELGPGSGFFAKSWMAHYPGTTYMAQETDSSCHAGLKEIGVELVNESLITANSPSVDLVVMSHVLEHVTAPKRFIKDSTRNLRNGGILFIEVPCLDYQHKSTDEPHLLFFEKKSMEHLLFAAGFENIELGYFGQQIDKLRSASVLRRILMALRSKLIGLGVIWPFVRHGNGIDALLNPIEQAAIEPFKAHVESHNPAWWLRAVAQKRPIE